MKSWPYGISGNGIYFPSYRIRNALYKERTGRNLQCVQTLWASAVPGRSKTWIWPGKPETDVTLEDIARYTDVFYIGGTKAGALCGEAVVFTKKAPKHFMTMVKQQGALLAKGAFWESSLILYLQMICIQRSAETPLTLLWSWKSSSGKGYQLYIDSPTNQQFIILENNKKEELAKKVRFDFWEKYDEDHTVIRFATSWGTKMEDIDALIELL